MKKTVAIIGGGSCALMLACLLDSEKYNVSIYEKNAALGRKFLVAGDGGLNLTHSEPPGNFISRYKPFSFLETAFRHFSNIDFVNWINELGVETYVGSSGRVFPKKGIKPVEVLNRFLEKIKGNGVSIHTRHEWAGFAPSGELLFKNNYGETSVKADLVVFCLGGASWPVTGSKGDWLNYFSEQKISTKPFEASNCYFRIDWPVEMIAAIEGKALKNCSISCNNKTVNGEVVLTKAGIEGSGVYPLSPEIRTELNAQGYAEIRIDLKPANTGSFLSEKINRPKGKLSHTAHIAKQLNLNAIHLTLLKNYLSKDDFLDAGKLATVIKNLKLKITGLGPVEDSISTVGGIDLNELNENFEFKKIPGVFAIGEMLDYDAPTGGYLLQSCFTMAKALADYLNDK